MIAVITLLIELVMLALINLGQNSNSISNATASVLIFLFSASFFISVQSSRKLKLYRSSLMLGYLLRIFLLYFDIFGRNVFILPHSAADSEAFYSNMVYYSQGMVFRSGTYGTYIEMMGTVFKYIGINRLYGQFLNLLFSIVALIFLAYALNELNVDDNVKHRIYKILCFLPNYAILSSVLLREAPVNMFLTISFYFIVQWYMFKQEKYFLLASVFVLPAAAMHSGSIAVLVGYIIIRFIYDNESEKFVLKLRNIVVTVVIVTITAYVLSRTGGRFLGKFKNVDSIDDVAITSYAGGSSYAQYVGDSSNPLRMIVYTIPRIFYFIFSPLPWQWRGLSDIIMFLFSSIFYFLTVLNTIQFLHSKEKHNRPLVIALFIVAMTTVFVFAWGTSNSGTAARHRDKIITIFALIWALSYNWNESNKKNRRRRREA